MTITLIGIFINQKPQENRSYAQTGFVTTRVVNGGSLTAMEFAPDGRLFYLEKGGTVKVVKNNTVLGTPFMKISNINSDGERGLLGIAFDPNFVSNKYVYLYYTMGNPLHNRVIRVTANGDVAAASSEKNIIDLPGLGATNHNGGAIHFGTDGKLYIGVGDNANGGNASSMNTPLGKMLRVNADGSIPADNPFYNSTSGNSRAIWATGLRNPFTFAVQPGSGRIFANDVGDNGDKRFEEIDDIQKGKNYGWPSAWGNGGSGGERPIYSYKDGGCAITGGTFYNPSVVSFPNTYLGKYFFADYCGGWIKTLDPASKQVSTFKSGVSSPVDLKTGPEGALYVLSADGGGIQKITYGNPSNQPLPTTKPPTTAGAPVGTIVTPKDKTKYSAGNTISFSGTGTDPQDGTLADKAFSWKIAFHHGTHTHPFKEGLTGKSGTFTIPQTGEWASDVWYRINLNVTDSSGLTHTSYVDVVPNVVTLTLATVPSGLQVAIESVPDTSPYSQKTVVGMKRPIGTTPTQTLNGKSYGLVSWSDGGAATHEIVAPAADRTYTATFKEGWTPGSVAQPSISSGLYCLGACPTLPDDNNSGGGGGGNTVDPTPAGDPSQQPTDRKGLILRFLELILQFLQLLRSLL